MNSFTSMEFDRVELIYNQFKNAAVQNLTNEVFLPVETVSAGKVPRLLRLIIFMNLIKKRLLKS